MYEALARHFVCIRLLENLYVGHQILIMEYLHDAVSKNMRAKLKLENSQK